MSNQNNKNEGGVVLPDESVFESKKSMFEAITPEGSAFHVFDHVEYPEEGGILVYYKGMLYPKRGFPYPEAVWMNDITKRVTMTMVNSLGMKEMILPLASIMILPWKRKIKIVEKVFENYIRIGNWLMHEHFLEPRRYSKPVVAIQGLLSRLFFNLGISETIASGVSKIVGTMIEYDDAYRYRIQDIGTEIKWPELANHPTKELKRLLDIFISRESHKQVKSKAESLYRIIQLAMMHPRIRRAFKKTIADTSTKDTKWLSLGNLDRYHVLMRGDYKFLGLSFDVRKKLYIDCHTKSTCCNAEVKEYMRAGSEVETYTVCKKCLKFCEVVQNFPPMVQVNHQTS